MFVRFARPFPRALAVAGLALLASAAPAAELAYSFPPGASFTYRVRNVSSPPTQSEIVSNADYAFVAEGAGPYVLTASITGSSSDFEMGNPVASFTLTGDGQASDLASDALADPVDGSFVRNAPGLFPPLPAGDVAVGQTWTAQAVLHAPEIDRTGSFTSLRTATTYTYAGDVTTDDGRLLRVVDFTTTEAPGARAKMEVTGRTWLDAELGRPIATEASGFVKVKVAFLWVKVPTTYSLREVAPAS